MTSDDESIAAIEATVEARLSTWASPSDVPALSAPYHIPKRRRKRHKRHKPISPSLDSAPPPSASLQSSLSTSVADIEARLLKRTLIRPREKPSANPLLPATGPTFSTSNRIVPTREHASSSSPSSRPPSNSQRQEAGKGDLFDVAQFVESHRREVNRFGSTALNKRDRKTFETMDRMRLGCRAPKRQKMPIGLLQVKRRNLRAREERQRQLDIASGMLVRCKRCK